jgi:hypothetical protein
VAHLSLDPDTTLHVNEPWRTTLRASADSSSGLWYTHVSDIPVMNNFAVHILIFKLLCFALIQNLVIFYQKIMIISFQIFKSHF